MSRGMSRADRLREMERLYVERAFTDIEMAERLGVDRTVVFKDRRLLEGDVPFVEVERGRHKIDRSRYLSGIRVNLHEALALYLPARRAARQTLIAQPHVANALEKLAAALRQPMTERLVKAANAILAQSTRPERIAIMETVARGWVEQFEVRIMYRGLHARQAGRHTLSPYLIEPSLWSDGAYVIGHSDYFDGVAVFKIERIEEAVLTPTPFDIPENFDEQELLRYAWGIWRGEGEPERVVLRFAPGDATRRVKESQWHPQQEPIVDTEGGGCLWAALVSEPKEMVPWIRGWGADVEVVEPKELREALMAESRKLARLYGAVEDRPMPRHLVLWAKADTKTRRVHRLVCHLIDVGQVALALWECAINDQLKKQIADWLNLDTSGAGKLVAFWASVHDLGKASPAFQDHPSLDDALRSQIRQELKQAGFNLPARGSERHARHEVISTWSLGSPQGERLLIEQSSLPPDIAGLVAQTIGGHHGAWPNSTQFSPTALKREDKGDETWNQARIALVRDLAGIFKPPAIHVFAPDTARDNAMLTLISGIVSVADWLGSDEHHFGYEDQVSDLGDYVRKSQEHARLAIAKANWQTPPDATGFDFATLFEFQPNQAQQQVGNALNGVTLPALVILEAPMGSGKTEAALATYLRWAQAEKRAGLYVAMPTTATSNQMHQRVTRFLNKQYGPAVDPLLVHAQALLSGPLPADDSVKENNEQDERAATQTWFLPRKKSLLVPFGVGTVDQALMSILQTKHFFVRLLGLSHKVVIFDEVHAYDAYMSVLFERLLSWLHQIGASVIVLSATLPQDTRARLVRAYGGAEAELPTKCYPRLTFAGADGKIDVVELTPPPEKKLEFDWIDRDPTAIVQRLSDELQTGGCAAVICNTVTRAQEIYETVLSAGLCQEDNVILFHARFPMAGREGIERKVLAKFGPNKEDKTKANPDRPHKAIKAIVIATQVIEQSLDLDFDVMISDPAPVDLLLQRTGRLHRHAVNDATRKHPFRLLITQPAVEEGVPQFERGDKYVYDEYVLLRSWLALQSMASKQIRLPGDLSDLIEQVYGDALPVSAPELQCALDNAKCEMEKDERKEKFKARQRLVLPPDDDELLWGDNAALEEDDPAVHEAFQALTRADRPGLSVVCLHDLGGKLFLEPDGSGVEYNPNVLPDDELARELARRSVTIRRPYVEKHLLTEPGSPLVQAMLMRWKKTAMLRYHRVAIFKDGVCPIEGTPYVLRLTRKLGLQIGKEE